MFVAAASAHAQGQRGSLELDIVCLRRLRRVSGIADEGGYAFLFMRLSFPKYGSTRPDDGGLPLCSQNYAGEWS